MVTRRANVLISSHAAVPAVHCALGMRVTIDTFEGAVVGLRGVTVCAAVPAPWRMIAAAADGEEIVMWEERRGLPRESAVTERAICREACGSVVRARCCKVRLAVARHAFGGCAPEPFLGMARAAWHGFVDSSRGEVCLIVIESGEPRRCICRMAFCAFVAEARRCMVDCQRCIIIFAMAGNAVHRSSLEPQCRVAGDARCVAVLAAQGKCGGVMIELHREDHRRPSCGAVAIRTWLPHGAMGRILCTGNSCQERNQEDPGRQNTADATDMQVRTHIFPFMD
jgi:hypothetical protein